jgi:hypothetical protein
MEELAIDGIMILKLILEVGCEGMDWLGRFYLTQDSVMW